MRVVLDRSLFRDDPDFHDFVFDLVGIALRRGHRVDTRPSWGTEAGQEFVRGWASTKPRPLQRRLLSALDRAPAAWIVPRQELQLLVVAEAPGPLPETGRRLELRAGDEALEFVGRPLSVVVEDKINDWNFLRLCAEHEWTALLDQAVLDGWIRPEHGGGLGSMKRLVHSLLKKPLERVRHFVLADSDRPCAGQVMDEAYELDKACSALVLHYILQRRAIENYLPEGALDRWADGSPERQSWLATFRALTADQQHYFKLKRGGDGGFAKHGHQSHPSV